MRRIVFFLIISIILTFSACSLQDGTTNVTNEEEKVGRNNFLEGPTVSSIGNQSAYNETQDDNDLSDPRVQPNSTPTHNIKVGESFPMENLLASGELRCTITNAYAVTKQADIPSMDCLYPEEFLSLNEENEWETLEVPEFIQGNGQFAEGYYLILVDVHVESYDAVRLTTKDVDSAGYPLGEFDDPYMFRALSGLFLIDPTNPNNTEDNYRGLANESYYSGFRKDLIAQHMHAVFRLKPGETIDYTIGYVLNTRKFREKNYELKLSNLCICTGMSPQYGYVIDLCIEDKK